MLTVIELFENNEFKVSYCAVEKQENKVRISDGVKTIEEFNNRSQQIKEESFVAASFEKEAKKVLGTKLAMLLGGFSSSFFYKLFNKISKKLSKKPLSHKYFKANNARSIINQIERSATSIGANIREAKYAHSKADFVSKLQISLKECYETEYWLELLQRAEIVPFETVTVLLHDCGSLRRMLISSINTTKSNLEKQTL